MYDFSNPTEPLPFVQPPLDGLTPEEETDVRIKAALIGCAARLIFFVLCILLLGLLGSCATRRPTVVQLRDSTDTHVHIHTVFVPDTVLVPLPPERVVITTPDTASTLRTSVAESYAAIRGGLLHHDLRNLPQPISVPVQNKVITRDSIVYQARDVPVPVPVVQEVEKPLTWLQQSQIWLGRMVLAVIAVAAAGWLVRRYVRARLKPPLT